jgi:hypothetical protein
MVFLHFDHFLPLLLSNISDFFDGHYSHFLDLVVDLLNMDRVLLHMYDSVAK